MFLLKISISLSILTLLGAVNVSAAGSDHPDPSTVRAALEAQGKSGRERSLSSGVQAQAAAQKVSPLLDFSMRGSGTLTDFTDLACSGAICNASNGGCECLIFQGNLKATQVGNATWNASITVNIDDCTNTGTTSLVGGFCCFGDGVLNATTGSGKSASTLAMSFTGPVCDDPNAADDTSIQGGFIIVTANSSGKFLHSAGTGQVNAFMASDGTIYLAGRGVLQVVSPF